MWKRTTGCPFPIWSIYITTSAQVPTWIRPGTYRVPFGKGRCLVCVDDKSKTEALKTAENEFGAASQQITVTKGSVNEWDEWSTEVVTDVGPAEWWKITISHYQPSITVYMWKRVYNKGDIEKYNAFNITEEQMTDNILYGEQAIIDAETLKAKQPDPYNPSPAQAPTP